MQWWCSATGEPWTWQWQAYPGVWAFVGLLAFWYFRTVGRSDGRTVGTMSAGPPVRPSDHAWFLTGLFSIWLALDWPIGALGAGYLASFHTITYILLSFIAPPCLILGLPRAAIIAGLGRPAVSHLLRVAARPWVGLATFNVILLTTHVPDVVDALMTSQVGALLIDLGWLVGGWCLWWPVMAPPEVARLRRPLKMAYLFLSTIIPIIPSAFLTFADYPVYATYELAPRIFTILTAQQDQQLAGLLMKIVGDLPVWFGFGVIFFRWARESEQVPPPVHPGALGQVRS
jgi:putative membrane protein